MTTIADSDSGMQGQTQEAVAASNDARRRRWVHLLGSQHYEPVIFDVLNGELTKYMNSRAVDPTDIVSHMRECALILASAPKVFLAAVEGNLVSRMTLDADLQAEYAVMQQRANYQPSIYIHLLADEEGQAPSPVQYLPIRDMIEDYISGCPSEHAHQIDDITPPFVLLEASIQGYRKYLSTQSTNRSIKRLAVFNRPLQSPHRWYRVSMRAASTSSTKSTPQLPTLRSGLRPQRSQTSCSTPRSPEL